jgi:hypothetical protein
MHEVASKSYVESYVELGQACQADELIGVLTTSMPKHKAVETFTTFTTFTAASCLIHLLG